MHNNEDLPSIDDILEDNSLPSYKDFMEEESELPSVEEFTTLSEESQTIDDVNGNAFLEVTDVVPAPEWSELVRMVNDVRKDIPQIPEIKYYDDQLAEIVEQINNIQKNVDDHGPRLNAIDLLSERIEEVNESIPTFPDWVRKVEEIPDFSWIGKSFSLFEVNFKRVQKNLDVIRESFERKVESLNEVIDVKEFESKVDIKTLTENLNETNQTLEEQRQSILKEYKETVTKLYEFRDTFKDDDRKLKKSIASEQNKLQQSIEKQLQDINEQSVKADETILGFYTSLKEEIAGQFESLPEIKDYDEDISRLDEDIDTIKRRLRGLDNISLKKEIKELGQLAENLKKEQARFKELNEELQEGLLNQPPSELQTAGDQTDPLTPLDQQFATLEDLQKHYRLFINRITQQLSTIGGGGSVWLWDLQDVNIGTPTNGTYPPVNNGDLLMFDASTSTWVGVASTAVNNPDDTGLDDVLSVGNTSSLGFSVGPSTITELTISGTTVGIGSTVNSLFVEGNTTINGNLNVIGTITKKDITELDSLGLVTARSGIDIGFDPVQTQFYPDGDGIMSGILTVADLNVQNHSTFVTVEATGDVTIPEGDLILGLTTVTSTAAEINTLDGVTAGTVSPSKAVVVDSDKDISGFRNVTLEGWLIAPILDISGNVDIDGITNLDVVDIDGDTHIDASLDVTGQTTLDNLNVSGVTTFSGTLDLDGDVDIDGHLEVDNLNVSGVSTFASPADFNSDVDIDGHLEVDNLNVSGVATFSGSLDLDGDVDIDGHLEVDNLNVSGVSTFAHQVGINSNLNVTGISTLQGDVSFGSSAYFTDDNRILMGNSEDLQIWHSASGGNSIIQNATGQLQLRSNTIRLLNAATDEDFAFFNDDGSVELYFDNVKQFETTGYGVTIRNTRTQNLLVTGIATVSSDLDLNGDVDIDGHLEVDNLGVSGVSTFASDVDINANLDVSGITTLNSMKLNTGGFVNAILDEDTMSSDDASALATQQSIRAFVGLTSNAMDLDFVGDSGVGHVGLNTQNMQIHGTSGEIVTAVSGAGVTIALTEDVTVRRDLDVLRNLNVVGNVTIGGTGASLVADTLQVTDADIILGFTTDAAGNNVSNDTTANHGGIAIASTEGTPLVTIAVAGIDTIPPTYKKFMWFKKNTFTGLNTDAFVMNYGLAVGTTSMDDGTRLAVGDNIQMTDDDIFGVRNINTTGVITAVTFVGDLTGDATGQLIGNVSGNVNSLGVSTFTTLDVNGDVIIDGSVVVKNLATSGVNTFNGTMDFNGDVDIDGHTEIDNLNVSGVSTFASAVDINANIDVDGYTELDDLNVTGLATFTDPVDINSTLDVSGQTELDDVNISGIATFAGTLDLNGDVDIDGHLEVDNLGVAGVATFSDTVNVIDNKKLQLGNDGDLQIYHGVVGGGSTSYIDNNTGPLYIRNNVDDDDGGNIIIEAKSGKASAVFQDDEGVRLYYNDAEKFETTEQGIDVTGHTETDSLNVSGIATFAGTLDLNGDVDIDGHLEVDDINVSGALTAATAFITGDFDVDGTTNLDAVDIDGNANIAGNVLFSGGATNMVLTDNTAGALDIKEGTTSYMKFDTTNDAEKISIGVTADFNGDVDIDGQLEVDNLNVSGIATFSGTLDLDGNVDIDGHLEVDNLNVSGVSTFASAVDINSTLDVSGQTELDDVNISGIATFAGTLDLNGDVDIDGHLEVDNLNVSGVSTFAGAADFNSDVDIDGHLEVDNINVTGIATFGGTLDFDGDVDIDGHLEVDNVNVSGVATFQGDTQIGVNTNQTLDLNSFIDGNLIPKTNQTFNIGNNNNKWNNLVANNATLSVLNMGSNIHLNGGNSGIITATSFSGSGNNLTGIVTNIVAGDHISINQGQGEVIISGITTDNVATTNLLVTGITTLGSSNGIGTVTIGVGTTALLVEGNARVTGILTIGTGSITLDGDNDMIYVGSGVTIMSTGEAEYTGVVTASGGFVSNGDILIKGAGSTTTTTDYSEVTLSSLSPSSFNLTYDRQATGFVLDTGTVASGNALFHADSNFYYYVATSGGFNTGRILIWSVEDNNWVVLLNIGEDYTEGNVTNNEAVGSVAGTATVTATSQTEDGRSVPQASSNIVYASSSSSTAGVGVATLTSDGDAQFTGIVTSSGGFVGDLTGTLQTAAQPNITSVGTLSAVTVSGDITANGNIAGDNSTNITGIAGVTASTLTGTLQTAAQTNVTSLGTLTALTVAGNINANGNIVGDDSTNITAVNDITALGDVTAVDGIFSGNLSIGGTLTYEDVTNVDSVGVITARSGIDVTGGTSSIATRINIGASDLNNRAVNAISNSPTAGSVSANNHNSGGVLFQGYNSSVDPNNATFVVQSNGTTGIGTDSPDYKFHVNEDGGSSIAGLFETNQSDSFVSFQASGTTSSSTVRIGATANDFQVFIDGGYRFQVGSDSNVSIGGATPNAFSNYTVLTIGGAGAVTGSGVDFERSDGNIYGRVFADADGLQVAVNQSGDSIRFETSGATERVRITSAGNVGIGTDDPLRQLEVFNTGHATAALKGDTQSSLFFVDSGDSNIGQISYVHADNYMYFRVNDAERVRITSGGVLVVGATSATGDEIIRCTGSNSGGSGIFIQNSNGATDSSADLWFGNWSGSSTGTPQARIQAVNTNTANASTALAFWTYSGSSTAEHMRIASDGDVGIGTDDPSTKLHVAGDITIANGSEQNAIRTNSAGQLQFLRNAAVNNQVVMTLDDNNGNVGIGTDSPNATLQVAGDQPETWCHDYTAAGDASNNGAAFVISRDNDDTLQTDDRIGRLRWRGQASDAPFIGADITGQITNGNTNRSNTECELQFATMASGATGALTKMTLTSGGILLVGTEDTIASTTSELLQIQNSNGGKIALSRNKAAIADGNDLGEINFYGNEGTARRSARIVCSADADQTDTSSTGRLTFFTTPAGTVTPVERLRITSGGVLSVGVVGEDWDSTYKALQIGAGSLVGQAEGDGSTTNWSNNAYYDDTNNRWEYIAADQASQISQVDGITIFRTAAAGTADAALTWTETMRLTADGKLGINANNPGGQLCVSDASTYTVNIGPNGGDGALVSTLGGSASLALGTDSAERLRITSAGLVGIGETDPQAKLVVRDDSSSAGHTVLRLENLTTAATPTECNMQMWLNNSNSLNPGIQIGAIENGNDSYADIVFKTTPQSSSETMEERMRITAGGNVGINESNPGAKLDVGFDSSLVVGLLLDNSAQGTSAQFKSGSSLVGSITVTSTATSFNETSDYRLKENVNNLGGAIDRVKQLSPKRFNFIADPDNTVDGFLAHEVSSVVPEAVSGEKDEVDSNNDPVLQMMDKSKLVPLLTAALQEAITKIEALEAEVTALKG